MCRSPCCNKRTAVLRPRVESLERMLNDAEVLAYLEGRLGLSWRGVAWRGVALVPLI